MSDVKTPPLKPMPDEDTPRTQDVRTDYRARPVKGEVDIRAIHRELAKRYPVIRARLAE